MHIIIAVPQANELRPLLGRLDCLGHSAQPLMLGNMPCHSIPSLSATAAVCGHGKTQFALQCQYLIDRSDHLGALLCVGAAGALSSDVQFGDIVLGECTVEHDYKLRFEPADLPRHEASKALLDEFHKAEGTAMIHTHVGPIASGDEDIVDAFRARELRESTGAICVAWEGSGGARAAAFNGIPFLEIRCITDGADADAATSFRTNCDKLIPNVADMIVRWRLG